MIKGVWIRREERVFGKLGKWGGEGRWENRAGSRMNVKGKTLARNQEHEVRRG